MIEMAKPPPYARINEPQFIELQRLTAARQKWDVVFIAGMAGLLSSILCLGIVFGTVAAGVAWHIKALAPLSLIPAIVITVVGMQKRNKFRDERNTLLDSLVIGDSDEVANG